MKQQPSPISWKLNSKMITSLIVTGGQDLKETIASIKDLGPVLVADLDKIPFYDDYSAVYNQLLTKVKTEWVFRIDPGEVLTSGKEFLTLEKPDEMYRVMVLNGDLLTKEPRLFRKKERFSRRAFADIEDRAEQTLPVVIHSETKLDVERIAKCLEVWKEKEPLSPEPEYYSACFQLMTGQYQKFLTTAENYIINLNQSIHSSTMLKYYMASLVKKDVGRALKLILETLAAYPLMAELWCSLGDLYLFQIKEYERAYAFYENAIILGSRRLQEDVMPMEISKYDEYPRKMMNLIGQTIKRAISLF